MLLFKMFLFFPPCIRESARSRTHARLQSRIGCYRLLFHAVSLTFHIQLVVCLGVFSQCQGEAWSPVSMFLCGISAQEPVHEVMDNLLGLSWLMGLARGRVNSSLNLLLAFNCGIIFLGVMYRIKWEALFDSGLTCRDDDDDTLLAVTCDLQSRERWTRWCRANPLTLSLQPRGELASPTPQ